MLLYIYITPVPHFAENTTGSDRLDVRVFDSNYGLLGKKTKHSSIK